MAEAISLVLGVGIAAVVLYLINSQLNDEEHSILKLFLMIGMLSLLLLLPKIMGDSTNNCQVVVANETQANASLKLYYYEQQCFEQPTTSVGTFMKIIFWLFRGVILYIIVYLFWQAIKVLGMMRGRKNG